MKEYHVILRTPHDKQRAFIDSPAKRKVIRAGRRGGKTVGIAIYAVQRFLAGKRVLYAAPTQDQIDRFWTEIRNALAEPIEAGVLYKNETRHVVEVASTEQRIRAKTAWNADTLRGDYADELILDEFQLMSEDTWDTVGAPMLLDNDGNATFIYTPPSLRSRSTSKASDPQHAAKLFKRAAQDTTGRWAVFHFSSYDNPHLPREAINELAQDMSAVAYRMEIMAEDVDEAPGALWTRATLEDGRLLMAPKDFELIVVGVDPSATSTGDEAGIVTAGRARVGNLAHLYTLADDSAQGHPAEWARRAVEAYYRWKANYIVAEANNGGEMVALTIATIDPAVPVRLVHASRGKQTRAEPIAATYSGNTELGLPVRGHHVGVFPALEDELCLWQPGQSSPNRLDALVWACTALLEGTSTWQDTVNLGHVENYTPAWA